MTTTPEQPKDPRRSGIRALLLAVSYCLPVVVLVVAGCHRDTQPAPVAPALTSTPQAPAFVGSQACAECHPGEFGDHAKTSHSITLHVMDKNHLGSIAPPAGRIAGTGYAVGTRGGRFAIAAPGYSEVIAPLDLAFGSGRSGMTYVSIDGDRIADAQMSYFPKLKRWYLTPGHTPKPPSVLGLRYEPAFSRQCIQCHSTTMPADSLMVEPKFFGVGCEACHGPGSTHRAAVKQGDPGTRTIALGTKATVDEINNVCGKCHAPRQDMADPAIAMNSTHRFQSLGLVESRCFKEGGRAISCVTCHNPHRDASKDLSKYEAVCLRCHAGPAASKPRLPGGIAGKTCPVNSRAGCTGCHMPPKRIFDDSNVPITLSDHLIHVQKTKTTSVPGASLPSP